VLDETVARLKKDHVLYVVTLAGFEGVAPVQGRLLELAGDSLLQLIRTQHLDRPVLIGHSLGGTLSIQFAESHSDSISGVVAVDGLPIFPGTEGVPGWPRSAFPCLRSRPTMPPISPSCTPDFGTAKDRLLRRTIAGHAELEVVSIAPARHFVMFDQPDAFAAALTRFLAALPAK